MIQGRNEVWSRLEKQNIEGCYWFHAPSLGEFEQGRPLIESIKGADPTAKVLLTFFSPSGYDVRHNYPFADVVCYLPFDSHRNAVKFVEKVKPAKAIFVKYDIWYHYLNVLHQKHIPAYLISAIFREQQIFFKNYGAWYKKALLLYTQIFVQDPASFELLKIHGITRSAVARDTRFDRVYEIVKNAKQIPELISFKGKSTVVVSGSTWPKDEDLLIEYIHQSSDELKFVIAPHEVHDAHVEAICKKLTVAYQKWSTLDPAKLVSSKVLIIDTIGLLSSLYRYGEWAYVGGGFGVGIHNTLEAATYGIPVVFGPNYQKFKEARDLIQRGGAFSVQSFDDLKTQFDMFANNQEERMEAGKVASMYVKQKKGATRYILSVIG